MGGKLHVPFSVVSCFSFLWNMFRRLDAILYCDRPQSLRLKMASKRRDMFHKNEKQETTENGPNMTECKEAIECADMSADMQKDAVNCAKQAMEEFNVEKDIAACIKKEFDRKYNPTWHCVVGRNFGSYVTHETRHFIYFRFGTVSILLFKCG